MNKNKITIVKQVRHLRIQNLIKQYHYFSKPVLIYSPFAKGIKKIRFTNIFIAPDTIETDYTDYVLNYMNKQQNIYFPIYQFIKQKLSFIFPNSKKYIVETIKIN